MNFPCEEDLGEAEEGGMMNSSSLTMENENDQGDKRKINEVKRKTHRMPACNPPQ